MERLDMYSNEFVWYFHHLHEANVRTEVRPSIYPCNYKSFPLRIFLFSFPLHAPPPFLFWSFLSHLPFLYFLQVCDECMKKVLELFKFISTVEI